MSTAIQPAQSFDLSPQSIEQALDLADRLSKSNMVPKDYQNNPGNILVAIQWGMELGLKPLQAMQNIAVINGRPSLWGDAVIALVRSSPLCEYIIETTDGDTAICRVKRRGEDEQVRTFSDADAKAAGLLGKQGPWTQYKPRMRQMRARAFALRDVFPDVLKGMPVAEEVMDMPPERDITPKASVQALASAAVAAVQDEAAGAVSDDDKELAIMQLELAANNGLQAFRTAWTALDEKMKTAIGIEERNRIDALAKAAVVEIEQ